MSVLLVNSIGGEMSKEEYREMTPVEFSDFIETWCIELHKAAGKNWWNVVYDKKEEFRQTVRDVFEKLQPISVRI